MSIKRLSILLILFSFYIVPSANAGENESLKTMANIMMNLNHFPSDGEKGQLADIAKNTSSLNIKIIATAMLNLQHSASSADKRQLQKVINDSAASKNVKSLASIVHSLNHKPSRTDKKALSGMVNIATDM